MENEFLYRRTLEQKLKIFEEELLTESRMVES
jgi:hypothetical protein